MYSIHDCGCIPQRRGRKVWFKMMKTSRPFVSIIFIIVIIFIIRGETRCNRRVGSPPEPLGPPASWNRVVESKSRRFWLEPAMSHDLFQPIKKGLKGQCHEIFCFWFFSWISFPQAPEYSIRAFSIFFENSRRYSQLKVDHRYQRHRWQICHRYQRHRRQILPLVLLVLLIPVENLPPVSTMPVANLPPVSTTPVANNGINIRLQIP